MVYVKLHVYADRLVPKNNHPVESENTNIWDWELPVKQKVIFVIWSVSARLFYAMLCCARLCKAVQGCARLCKAVQDHAERGIQQAASTQGKIESLCENTHRIILKNCSN
jgi:hypothetical protein